MKSEPAAVERAAVQALLATLDELTTSTHSLRERDVLTGPLFGEWFVATGLRQRQLIVNAMAATDIWEATATPSLPNGADAERELLMERVHEIRDREQLLATLDQDILKRQELQRRLIDDVSLEDEQLMLDVRQQTEQTHESITGILQAVTLLHNRVLIVNQDWFAEAWQKVAASQGIAHTTSEERRDDGSVSRTLTMTFDRDKKPQRPRWWQRRSR